MPPSLRTAKRLQQHLCSGIFRNAGANVFACCRESPASTSSSPRALVVSWRKSRGKFARAAASLLDRLAANRPAVTVVLVRSGASISPGAGRIFTPRRMRFCSIRGRSGLQKASESQGHRRARAALFVIRHCTRSHPASWRLPLVWIQAFPAKAAMAPPVAGCVGTPERIGITIRG